MSEHDKNKWNRLYRDWQGRRHNQPDTEPSSFVRALDGMLPRSGRALDVAGGRGRHAIWLAQRGLDVTLTDISDVALTTANRDARAAGVTLHTIQADFDADPIPPGPWQLILDIHFVDRSLFPAFARELAPGGYLVFMQPTMSNLSRHERPGARFLLDDGELPGLIEAINRTAPGPMLEIITYREGWLDSGRHEAQLVARRVALQGSEQQT